MIPAYYYDYELPSWFTGTEHLRDVLTRAWDCGNYLFGWGGPYCPECEFETMGTQLLDGLTEGPDDLGYRRLLYFGWALALGAAPTIISHDPDNPLPELVFHAVEARLRVPPHSVSQDWVSLCRAYCPLSGHQELNEAQLVLQELTRMLEKPDEVRDAALEQLELVTRGYPLGCYNWELFNWILLAVVPAAWSLRLPDAIYTYWGLVRSADQEDVLAVAAGHDLE